MNVHFLPADIHVQAIDRAARAQVIAVVDHNLHLATEDRREFFDTIRIGNVQGKQGYAPRIRSYGLDLFEEGGGFPRLGMAHVNRPRTRRLESFYQGQPQTTNFGEYLLPSAPEVPSYDIVHMESPTPLNPLGVKGAGEGGTIPVTSAIASAVDDALAPFGVVVRELPIEPKRIVEMIRDAG